LDLYQRPIFLEDSETGSSRFIHRNSNSVVVLTRMRESHDRLGHLQNNTTFISQRLRAIANPQRWFDTALGNAGIEGARGIPCATPSLRDWCRLGYT